MDSWGSLEKIYVFIYCFWCLSSQGGSHGSLHLSLSRLSICLFKSYLYQRFSVMFCFTLSIHLPICVSIVTVSFIWDLGKVNRNNPDVISVLCSVIFTIPISSSRAKKQKLPRDNMKYYTCPKFNFSYSHMSGLHCFTTLCHHSTLAYNILLWPLIPCHPRT